MELLAAVGAVAVVPAVTLLPGWVIARAGRGRADLFLSTWTGLGVTSVTGLALAYAGVFSLASLAGSVMAIAGASLIVGRMRPARRARDDTAAGATATRALACAAGLSAVLWCWPPFETLLAGADSTMYVNAGIYLARTGGLTVHDTVVPLLPKGTARELFASVNLLGTGPYIRLPGGLLMGSLERSEAIPAFFPLTPVWAGILAAAGGPEAAPAVAPLFAGLGLWAVVLFAGEAFGAAAATATALLLLANFAFWWFGRFAMSEPLTLAFLWGGLVLLGRGSALAAGLMLGLGGLARTETVPFLIAAIALWAIVTRVPRRRLLPLTAGFALVTGIVVATIVAVPSHHRAYFTNELAFMLLRAAPWLLFPAAHLASLVRVGILLLAAFILVGALGWRFGVGFWRSALGASTLGALGGALALYVRYGGQPEPVRHLAWLGTYCSWPLLGLAGLGGVLAWRRGGTVVRLAILLWIVVAVFFVTNPRISVYQPWAIRRFLPVVIPGLVVAASTALAHVGGSSNRAWRVAAVLALLGIVALEARPITKVYGRDYFRGSFQAVGGLARVLPEGAIAVIESDVADVQIQVPLWLAYGHEVVMLRGGTPRWRALMSALVESGRPVYWLTSPIGADEHPPVVPGLAFWTAADSHLAVRVPEGPEDDPPAHTVTRLAPLRVYRVGPAPTA